MPQIGPYTLYTIETGRFRLDGGAMFGIIPKPLWERRISSDDRNRIALNMRCLLIEGDGRLILIDTGIGSKFDDKFADIFGVDHAYADLHRSLQNAGFVVSDVTDVILTHLHFDHCGGSTHRTDNGLEPAFRNATYHIQRKHWSWAHAPNPREKGSFLNENFDPIEAAGQLHLVEGEGELWPGIELITIDGHTEAQQMVKISGGADDTLLYVADLLPTTAHLAPAWVMAYDVRPLVTVEEKEAFLNQAVDEDWTLFFEHDPEVVVADLERTEKGITTADPRSLQDL